MVMPVNPGPGQPAAVLGEGQRPCDAADLDAAGDPLGRGQVVIGEDVGDAQAAARPQDTEALGEHGGPVGRQVDHAVGDDYVYRAIWQLSLSSGRRGTLRSARRPRARWPGPGPA